jgi:hypothetical protein
MSDDKNMEDWARSFAGVAPAEEKKPEIAPKSIIVSRERRATVRPCNASRLEKLAAAILTLPTVPMMMGRGLGYVNPLHIGALSPALQAEGLIMKVHGPWNASGIFDVRECRTIDELRTHQASLPDGWSDAWFENKFGMWGAMRFFALTDDAYSFLFAPITYHEGDILPAIVAARIKTVIDRDGDIPRSWLFGQAPDCVGV